MSATTATGFDRAFVYVVLSGMVLDRATKLLADATLKGRAPLTLIDGLLDLHYVRNRGGVFGLLDHAPDVIRVLGTRIAPALLAVSIVLLYLKTPVSFRVLRVGWSCLLAGTVANLVDRFKHDGVIDFINLRVGEHSPSLTINVADLYVIAGALLLAWHAAGSSASPSLENP